MTEAMRPYECFAVAENGTATRLVGTEAALRHMGISPSVSAAVDLFMDDDMPVDRAAEMAMAAERGGQDAESFARHLLKLRGALR